MVSLMNNKAEKEKQKLTASVNAESANVLAHAYRNHCKNNGIEQRHEGFFEFLLQKNIIPQKRVTWFFIVEKYPYYLHKNDVVRERAILDLELVAPLNRRQIYNILKHYLTYFRTRKRVPFKDSYLKTQGKKP